MEKIWIIGAGYFGLRAVRGLSKFQKERHFTLVDPVKDTLLQAEGPNRTLEQADGVEYLVNHLHIGNEPDWIIPALPVHLVAEWCLARLGPDRLGRIALPPEIESLLPNPIRGLREEIYVSHATFRCPDDCAEPRDLCTITQKPRKQNMFEILENIERPRFQPLVIRSRQLGPGIGGYKPEQLFSLLSEVTQIQGNLLVATACRCHGVVTGLGQVK